MNELVVRVDDAIVHRLEEEIKKKRNAGQANSISDVFLIRFLESVCNHSKVLAVKLQQNKLFVRTYDTIKTYDDNRQTGNSDRKTVGEGPHASFPIQE